MLLIESKFNPLSNHMARTNFSEDTYHTINSGIRHVSSRLYSGSAPQEFALRFIIHIVEIMVKKVELVLLKLFERDLLIFHYFSVVLCNATIRCVSHG